METAARSRLPTFTRKTCQATLPQPPQPPQPPPSSSSSSLPENRDVVVRGGGLPQPHDPHVTSKQKTFRSNVGVLSAASKVKRSNWDVVGSAPPPPPPPPPPAHQLRSHVNGNSSRGAVESLARVHQPTRLRQTSDVVAVPSADATSCRRADRGRIANDLTSSFREHVTAPTDRPIARPAASSNPSGLQAKERFALSPSEEKPTPRCRQKQRRPVPDRSVVSRSYARPPAASLAEFNRPSQPVHLASSDCRAVVASSASAAQPCPVVSDLPGHERLHSRSLESDRTERVFRNLQLQQSRSLDKESVNVSPNRQNPSPLTASATHTKSPTRRNPNCGMRMVALRASVRRDVSHKQPSTVTRTTPLSQPIRATGGHDGGKGVTYAQIAVTAKGEQPIAEEEHVYEAIGVDPELHPQKPAEPFYHVYDVLARVRRPSPQEQRSRLLLQPRSNILSSNPSVAPRRPRAEPVPTSAASSRDGRRQPPQRHIEAPSNGGHVITNERADYVRHGIARRPPGMTAASGHVVAVSTKLRLSGTRPSPRKHGDVETSAKNSVGSSQLPVVLSAGKSLGPANKEPDEFYCRVSNLPAGRREQRNVHTTAASALQGESSAASMLPKSSTRGSASVQRRLPPPPPHRVNIASDRLTGNVARTTRSLRTPSLTAASATLATPGIDDGRRPHHADASCGKPVDRKMTKAATKATHVRAEGAAAATKPLNQSVSKLQRSVGRTSSGTQTDRSRGSKRTSRSCSPASTDTSGGESTERSGSASHRSKLTRRQLEHLDRFRSGGPAFRPSDRYERDCDGTLEALVSPSLKRVATTSRLHLTGNVRSVGMVKKVVEESGGDDEDDGDEEAPASVTWSSDEDGPGSRLSGHRLDLGTPETAPLAEACYSLNGKSSAGVVHEASDGVRLNSEPIPTEADECHTPHDVVDLTNDNDRARHSLMAEVAVANEPACDNLPGVDVMRLESTELVHLELNDLAESQRRQLTDTRKTEELPRSPPDEDVNLFDSGVVDVSDCSSVAQEEVSALPEVAKVAVARSGSFSSRSLGSALPRRLQRDISRSDDGYWTMQNSPASS